MTDTQHHSAALLDAVERTVEEVATTAAPAVVAIGRDGRGSGVVIAPDRVLTNAHHLRDRTTEVTFGDGTARQASLLAADPAGDVAVLEVETSGISPLPWSGGPPSLGAVVVALSRGRRAGRVTVGTVSGVDRSFRGPRGRPISGAVEHTAPLGRGATGGPLLDRDGRIVALNTHRLDDGFALARAADERLRRLVAGLLEGEAPAALALGVAVAPPEVARRLRRSVGLDERDGLLVRGVDPDGPGAGAGIDVGDLVIRAAGRDLTRVEDLFEVLAAHDPAGPLPLVVVRGVEEVSLEVDFGDAGETRDDED